MGFEIRDPVIKRWFNIGIVVLLCVLMIPGLAAAVVIATVVIPGNAEPEYVLRIQDLVHAGGVPADIGKLLISSIPALLAAVAFRPSNAGELTRTGRWSLLVLLAGGAIALMATFYLNPESSLQAGRLTEGARGIEHLRGGAEASLRLAMTYGILLLGLQVEVKS